MNLADVYSFIDSKKRAVKGLLAEPGLTLQQYISQIGEDNDKRLNLQANAYPMAGDKTVLNSPHQLDQFRAQLAKEGSDMAMAGMFVGPSSKTWDKVSAQKATQMEKSGADARKIWSDTGTWKAPDGMWRQEIDDSAGRLTAGNVSADQMRKVNGGEWIKEKDFLREHYKTPEAKAIRTRASMRNGRVINGDTPKLFDTMEHGLLSDAYPELDKIRVALDDKMPMGNGAFAEDSKAIILSPMHDDAALGVQLHEVQHAIQQREGFAKGGSPDGLSYALADDAGNLRKQARQLNDSAYRNDPLGPSELLKPGARKKSLELEKQARDLDTWVSRINEFGDGYANKAYRNLAGEAEARATQTRIPLDAAQRRATFPEDSYDTPIGQLIMRFQSQ